MKLTESTVIAIMMLYTINDADRSRPSDYGYTYFKQTEKRDDLWPTSFLSRALWTSLIDQTKTDLPLVVRLGSKADMCGTGGDVH